jgi:hypothetical protein
MAFRAALRKSSTIPGISSTLSLRGAANSSSTPSFIRGVAIRLSVLETGGGAAAVVPSGRSAPTTRPTCQSWQKNTAPFWWTASTMGFQASTCSVVQTPGVGRWPCAVSDTPVASVISSPPAVARCA